jgi:hypothetical protein
MKTKEELEAIRRGAFDRKMAPSIPPPRRAAARDEQRRVLWLYSKLDILSQALKDGRSSANGAIEELKIVLETA